MNRLLALSCAFPALFLASPAQASSDEQAWQTVSLSIDLPSNFKVTAETVARTGNAKGFYEIEQTAMLGYKLNKHVTVLAGYVHNPTYLHGDFRVKEHRLRQQVNFDNVAQVGPLKLGGRVRMEQRWREGETGTGWRLRPGVKAVLPFVGKTSLAFTHESFVNLNTTGFQKVSGYERMRNSVTVVVPLDKKLSVEAGYLNQHGFVRGGPDTSDHVLVVSLNASL